jgi:hypothetical protein
MASSDPAAESDEVYELSVNENASPITPSEWRASATATYKLEVPVRCPYCDAVISTIGIVGLTRAQVAFTSTLPRKGRVAICPECDRILPAELSGMV